MPSPKVSLGCRLSRVRPRPAGSPPSWQWGKNTSCQNDSKSPCQGVQTSQILCHKAASASSSLPAAQPNERIATERKDQVLQELWHLMASTSATNRLPDITPHGPARHPPTQQATSDPHLSQHYNHQSSINHTFIKGSAQPPEMYRQKCNRLSAKLRKWQASWSWIVRGCVPANFRQV